MIWAKKRFEVLKRDWFRCKYCWKNGKDVSLEVDHIISKKQWWDDSMDNLVCCCRECNIWKWSDTIEKPSKNLYKHKIDDCVFKVRQYFYTEWNKWFLWNIDKDTTTLLTMFINIYIKDDDVYCTRLDYPPLYGEWSIYGEDRKFVDHKKMKALFDQWGRFCDDVLSIMYNETLLYMDWLIEEVTDDNQWLPKNNQHTWRFVNRLNYVLTRDLCENYWDKKYIISRFTLHPKLLRDE